MANTNEIPEGFNPAQEISFASPDTQKSLTLTQDIVKRVSEIEQANDSRTLSEGTAAIAFAALGFIIRQDALKVASLVAAGFFAGAVAENMLSTFPISRFIKEKQTEMMQTVWNSLPESRRQEIVAHSSYTKT